MNVQIDRGSALATLNLTPLIDVVFLLLIFFLVATKFAEEERELKVMLPEASEAQPLVQTPRELVVNIDAEGRYVVRGQVLDIPQLEEVLHRTWVNNPAHATVIIRADRRVGWQYVVAAINACLKNNIRNYRTTTLPAEG